MNSEEKKAHLDKLSASQDKLLATLTSLTEEQFIYKPATDSWSIAELVEHIILSEKGILRAINKFGATPAKEAVAPTIDIEKLKAAVDNRGKKYQSPEYFIPKGIFTHTAAAMEAFNTHRASMYDFITTTEISLKLIGFPHFVFGMIDGANWLLFMSGHCERHVKQMEEVVERYKNN